MDFSNYQSQHDVKMTHLKMLLQMAKVDGKDHEFEDRFIKDVALQMGLTDEHVLEAEHYPENSNHALPKDEHQRMTFLYRLLFLMGMDGEVSRAEKELCHKLGFKLGVRPALIEDCIAVFIKHLKKGSPSKDLLKAIQKYMN